MRSLEFDICKIIWPKKIIVLRWRQKRKKIICSVETDTVAWCGDHTPDPASCRTKKTQCSNSKNLRSRSLFSLWSQVRVLWLLIWWLLEAYMVINFKAREISRGAHKLVQTPTLKKKCLRLILYSAPRKIIFLLFIYVHLSEFTLHNTV